ncbi:unnamed protein product [Musa hybrid cultivar]
MVLTSVCLLQQGRSFPVCVKRDVRMLAEKWRRRSSGAAEDFAYPPCNVC